MKIKFIEKDQNWQEQQTTYWFEVDGAEYAIADQNGELSLLDKNSYPIDDWNDHDNVKDALISEYTKHIND